MWRMLRVVTAVTGKRPAPVVYSISMIRDLSIHGSLGPVDFLAILSGRSLSEAYFYEETASSVRFFSRGNELTILEDGIRYSGTGGSFCEYMFGVDKPAKDSSNLKILNRLTMFGAFLDERDAVVFTSDTSGFESYYRLFLLGHATTNYFFLVSSDERTDVKGRQMRVLRSVGKFLKRTPLESEERDRELLSAFCSELGEDRTAVLIFKLVHRGNWEYLDAFQRFYFRSRMMSHEEDLHLREIAGRNDIDGYQQERMKIDVMYRHPENRAVVDEYRDILLRARGAGSLEHAEKARLTRLRTVSIRNNIPSVLLDTLDALLLKGKAVTEAKEMESQEETRTILEHLFLRDPALRGHILGEDIVRLVRAKHEAYTRNDKGFEQVLLDVGKACDEFSHQTGDFGVLEEFSTIVTYFDRYDAVMALLSRLAFMKGAGFGEESLRSLAGHRRAFQELEPGLFGEIFFGGMLRNRYVTSYGRKKLAMLMNGMERIGNGDASFREVVSELQGVMNEEQLYHEIRAALWEMMRSFFPGLETKKVRQAVRKEMMRDLAEEGRAVSIGQELFDKVFFDLQKESVYLNHILPEIVRTGDIRIREDFLENSGLDLFSVETLEEDFCAARGLDRSVLKSIREGREKRGDGGGERI